MFYLEVLIVEFYKSGECIYSLTPPIHNVDSNKLDEINRRRIERLSDLNLCALSIYDIQDESLRSNQKRTYKYNPVLNPLIYSKSLSNLTKLPHIIYLPSGKYSEKELKNILSDKSNNHFVLVGAPSRLSLIKTSLKEAYKISNEYTQSIGGIIIGERKNEARNMINKIKLGANFFISQCIYSYDIYKKLIIDYARIAKEENIELKPIALTFSPIGNIKGVEFMKWLGVNIPNDFEEKIKDHENFLDYSTMYLKELAHKLIDVCLENDIPYCLNFESIIAKKEEIYASIELAKIVTNNIEY